MFFFQLIRYALYFDYTLISYWYFVWVLTSTSEIFIRTNVELVFFLVLRQSIRICRPEKMDEFDNFYFLESSQIKLLLLNVGKTEFVNSGFLRGANTQFWSYFLPLFSKNIFVDIVFGTHIPQSPILVHKTDKFIVPYGSLIKLTKSVEIQRTKTSKTYAGRTKKSNLFEHAHRFLTTSCTFWRVRRRQCT